MRMLLGICAVMIMLSSCGIAQAQAEVKGKFTPPGDFRSIQIEKLKEENELLKKRIEALTSDLAQLTAPTGGPAKGPAATQPLKTSGVQSRGVGKNALCQAGNRRAKRIVVLGR